MYDAHDDAEVEADIRAIVNAMSASQLQEYIETAPPVLADALLRVVRADAFHATAGTPLEQAERIVRGFAVRPHLRYLSERIAQALKDVEDGKDRRIIVQMPPRSGKTLMATQVTAAWTLARHPDWPVALTSYSGTLATSWGRQVRRWADEGVLGSQVKVAPDAGAASGWETTEGGSFLSRSLREPLTGFGAKVLVIDDPHKDFADVHSKVSRDAVWNWWLSVAQTRLQPPSLVVVILTRWHEDDLAGRLLSEEHEGDPNDWEVVSFPAIAEKGDVLGRKPGQPLYSPLIQETEEQALARWATVQRSLGSYVWNAMYQQRPSPAKGAIFETDWWHYWTTDPAVADGDKIHLFDPEKATGGQWLDSWDFAFDKTDTSDYVVGQRWVMVGVNRYLIAQQRDRMNFTDMLAAMKRWATADPLTSPHGARVRKRLVEKKANGAAIITTLRKKIAGIKPVNPTTSKEARARAQTPEIESGNVLLPHPSMPGYAWVRDFVGEFREFPSGAHDDQVDAATQALAEYATPQAGGIATPAAGGRTIGGSRVSAAGSGRRIGR